MIYNVQYKQFKSEIGKITKAEVISKQNY